MLSESWWTRWGTPVRVFLISRAGLFLLAYLGLLLIPLPANPALARRDPLLDGWSRWDSGWYLAIADHGYTNIKDSTRNTDTKFFPVYPLLIRTLGYLIGDPGLAGVLISHMALLLGLMAVWALARDRFGDEVARRSLILLCVYPFSFFFSAVYTEALFLAATAGAFYFGERGRWLPAALCASVAGAARVPGCLVTLGLGLLYLEKIAFDPRKIRPDILILGLGALLPALHMAHMWSQFGDPLVFVHRHNLDWERVQEVPGEVAGGLGALTSPRGLLTGTYSGAILINALVFPVALASCGLVYTRVSKAWALWAALHLLVALDAWHGMGRYLTAVFPIFVAWALVLPEPAFWALAYLSTLLLALFTLLFNHWIFVG